MTRLNGKPLRILQLTDCHLGRNSDETLLGLRTADSLTDVLQKARSQEARFDLVLASGDISNDGTPESYERFLRAVRKHLPHTPIAWLEGNHDCPNAMHAVKLTPPLTQHVSIGAWRLILLNSRVPFEERGELPQSELDRLEALLEADSKSPTMIFLHHQLVPVGSAWVDQYVVSNASAFFDITDRYTNIKAVSWGHVHQEFFNVRNGVDLIATPSTCVQFKPKSDDFMVDSQMPGYRVYELFANGTYQTDISRVDEHLYTIDFASSGY